MRFFKHFVQILKGKSRTYLDYASSTPVDAKFLRYLRRQLPHVSDDVFAANPSALHREGVAARRVIDAARARVARVLDAHADEIIFTSGATESDNLAIVGTLTQWIADGIDPKDIVIFSSELEHAAVVEAIVPFVERGAQHNSFPIGEGVIDAKGILVPEHAKAVLITVMYVSNEIGTVQPIAEIAKRVRKLRKLYPETIFVLHTDATQAPAHVPLRVATLGVDLMTLGATKLYCHKGIGVLFKKRSLKLQPMMHGGGQERGLRPGTEPVQLIHEFSYALEYAALIREEETKRIQELQTYFESELKRHFPNIKITAEKLSRSPHITHVGVSDFDSELLVIELDARGIAVSAKSACKNDNDDESGIVEKLYGKNYGAIRFSFGRMTARSDLKHGLKALKAVLLKYTH
jgi:cysteine desulfurase